MKTILLSFALLLALQASDCATAGSIQDSSVTKAKRQVDAEDVQLEREFTEITPGATLRVPGDDRIGVLQRDDVGYFVTYAKGDYVRVKITRGERNTFFITAISNWGLLPKLPKRPGEAEVAREGK